MFWEWGERETRKRATMGESEKGERERERERGGGAVERESIENLYKIGK
jgi:hypothetical protein